MVVANLQTVINEYQLLASSSQRQKLERQTTMEHFQAFLQETELLEINSTYYLLFFGFLVVENYKPSTIMKFKEALKAPLMALGFQDFAELPQAAMFNKGVKTVARHSQGLS